MQLRVWFAAEEETPFAFDVSTVPEGKVVLLALAAYTKARRGDVDAVSGFECNSGSGWDELLTEENGETK